MSPHSLVQELLNRTDDHLWALVTNGLRLRLLRDNVALTRQAYVAFALEAMFPGQAYADSAPLCLLRPPHTSHAAPPAKFPLHAVPQQRTLREQPAHPNTT